MLALVTRPWVRVLLVGVTLLGFQTTVVSEVRLAGVVISLTLLLSASAGAVGGIERGAVAGFALGALHDLTLESPLGLGALAAAATGAVAGTIRARPMIPPWWLAALVVGLTSALGEIAFPLGQALIAQEPWVGHRLWQVAIVVGAANVVLAPAALPVARWCLRVPRPV
jgi:rod shape-determining protein MreD